jgi:hypothetical protein
VPGALASVFGFTSGVGHKRVRSSVQRNRGHTLDDPSYAVRERSLGVQDSAGKRSGPAPTRVRPGNIFGRDTPEGEKK